MRVEGNNDSPTRARRGLFRYGGLFLLVIGALACFVVPFVGVPLLGLGAVFGVIGLVMPEDADQSTPLPAENTGGSKA